VGAGAQGLEAVRLPIKQGRQVVEMGAYSGGPGRPEGIFDNYDAVATGTNLTIRASIFGFNPPARFAQGGRGERAASHV
jgi:hypothetical protein